MRGLNGSIWAHYAAHLSFWGKIYEWRQRPSRVGELAQWNTREYAWLGDLGPQDRTFLPGVDRRSLPPIGLFASTVSHK